MKSLIKNTLAIITFSLVTTSIAFAEEMTAKTTVESLNNTWNKAFNNSDASSLASLYAENAVLSPGNGKVLTGRAEIQNLFKSFFEAGLKNHQLEIVTVDGDDQTLYQVAKWSASGAEKDGVTVTYSGITTSVFKKDGNGKWVARTHIWNAGN
jgi:uncharacterized protein (TIGR02246 family)